MPFENSRARLQLSQPNAVSKGFEVVPLAMQERLGVAFEKGDEMDCLVRGCNFLQMAVPREVFTFRKGRPSYLDKGQCCGSSMAGSLHMTSVLDMLHAISCKKIKLKKCSAEHACCVP